MEYYLLRHLKLRQIIPGLAKDAGSWDTVLPYQGVRRIVIPDCQYSTYESIVQDLTSRGLKYGEGSVVVYLPPDSVAKSSFHVLKGDYPPDAGLKILKAAGEVGVSTYGPGLARKAVDRHLLLAANQLHVQGVGPRIYDLVELSCGDQIWTAYVMQHVEGRTPTISECEAGLAKLRSLEQKGIVKTVATRAFDGKDFRPPTCNGNAIIDGDGRFCYVDFQNFVVGDYGKYLDGLAHMAAEDSHFGGRRLLGGGRFLYQSIPGVNLPAKRSVEFRSSLYSGLMRDAGVSVKDRFVLDIGCNIGMMIAEYLRWGAKWCQGWDFPNVVPHTERLLLALGCTRFSTKGTALHHDRRLEDDLADWLKPSLEGCAISYLAVHGHIGWMEALGRIPWSFVIYEGHEKDSKEDVEKYLGELGRIVKFETRALTTFEDGTSRPRVAAILIRSGATV